MASGQQSDYSLTHILSRRRCSRFPVGRQKTRSTTTAVLTILEYYMFTQKHMKKQDGNLEWGNALTRQEVEGEQTYRRKGSPFPCFFLI